MAFVRENNVDYQRDSIQDDYRIGALNTNTNNSGPEETDKTSTRTPFGYDFSGDEGIDSDTDERVAVGSNNANVLRFVWRTVLIASRYDDIVAILQNCRCHDETNDDKIAMVPEKYVR